MASSGFLLRNEDWPSHPSSLIMSYPFEETCEHRDNTPAQRCKKAHETHGKAIESFRLERIHFDRAFGGYCDYCHSGQPAITCAGYCQTKGASVGMSVKHETKRNRARAVHR